MYAPISSDFIYVQSLYTSYLILTVCITNRLSTYTID